MNIEEEAEWTLIKEGTVENRQVSEYAQGVKLEQTGSFYRIVVGDTARGYITEAEAVKRYEWLTGEMSYEIRLILVRERQVLWAMREGYDAALFYNVSGVERLASLSACYPVLVLHKGETIGIVWNVVEIKEVW